MALHSSLPLAGFAFTTRRRLLEWLSRGGQAENLASSLLGQPWKAPPAHLLHPGKKGSVLFDIASVSSQFPANFTSSKRTPKNTAAPNKAAIPMCLPLKPAHEPGCAAS